MKKMKKATFLLITAMLFSCSTSPKIDLYIGLDLKSDQMQQFLKTLGKPEISKFEAKASSPEVIIGTDTIHAIEGSPASTYYIFKEKGVQIKLNDKDIVDAIFLFSEGKYGYRQYQEKLPYDLIFTDNRKIVNEKLGKPESSLGGIAEINVQCEDFWIKSKGISVTYNSTDSTNFSATISEICISKP